MFRARDTTPPAAAGRPIVFGFSLATSMISFLEPLPWYSLKGIEFHRNSEIGMKDRWRGP